MSSRISPTAHYTGAVWSKHGLSVPGFQTGTGRLLRAALTPANLVYRALGQPTLEDVLLARHRLLDAVVGDALERGEVSQVLELAAGYSPRGVRLMRRFGESHGLRYVEADLPAVVARKRAMLAAAGAGGSAAHRVVEVDALASAGPRSIGEVASRELDPGRGAAVIVEGLLTYFPLETFHAILGRIAAALAPLPAGLLACELHLSSEVDGVRGSAWFQALLGIFARGSVHLHFATLDEAERATRAAGFAEVELYRADEWLARLGIPVDRSARLVRAIAARTASPG